MSALSLKHGVNIEDSNSKLGLERQSQEGIDEDAAAAEDNIVGIGASSGTEMAPQSQTNITPDAQEEQLEVPQPEELASEEEESDE